MLVFNADNVRQKNFRRTDSGSRPSFEGIKFRKATSNKGKAKAEEEGREFIPIIDSKFYISESVWEDLGLASRALKPYFDGDQNKAFLLLTDEENGTIVTKTGRHADGQKKGKSFSHSIFEEDLVRVGHIDPNVIDENQYLTLTEVQEVEGAPDYVQKVFEVVKADSDPQPSVSTVGDAPIAHEGVKEEVLHGDPGMQERQVETQLEVEPEQEASDDFQDFSM